MDDPDTDAEREALLREVADLASWDAVRHPEKVVRSKEEDGSGLTGTQLLERARQRILDSNGGKPPRLLDPFAGGGAIPLEGLRLGCEVEASDLNPVAVLLLKGTLEFPQKYGQPDSLPVPDYIREADAEGARSFAGGELAEEYRSNPLATDVRYWGDWVLERARGEVAEFYPPDPDGSIPVAYLWSRTIPCPSCRAEMPLIRQYWLARKDKKKVALEPVLDHDGGRVDFRVAEGAEVSGSPEQATTSRGDARCLFCGQVVKAAQVKKIGLSGNLSAQMTAVVLRPEGKGGKRYRSITGADLEFSAAADRTRRGTDSRLINDLPAIPNEPLAYHPQYMVVRGYGLDEWGKLFNERQLLALTTFARLVGEAHEAMRGRGLGEDYAGAVTTYLGLAVDRLADRSSTLCRWDNGYEKIANTFTRQALSMVWDYAEGNPFSGSTGDFKSAVGWIVEVILHSSAASSRMALSPLADRRAASKIEQPATTNIIVSDPPYYDAINYADLSDFFYVWLKRSLGSSHPDLLALPLTPKREQTVMNVHASSGKGQGGREAARQYYVNGMSEAFHAMAMALDPGGLTGIVFAHTDPDAWSTLIEGLLAAGLVPDVSWPIDTEMETKSTGLGQARLKTSVWMACRRRASEADEAFLGDVLDEMRPVISRTVALLLEPGHPRARTSSSARSAPPFPCLGVTGACSAPMARRSPCGTSWTSCGGSRRRWHWSRCCMGRISAWSTHSRVST